MHRACAIAGATMLWLCCHSGAARAQLAACAAIPDDQERLACYDAVARREPSATPPAVAAPPALPMASQPVAARPPTELERRWELGPELKRGTFNLQPYRPVYALAHATNDINNDPQSPTRGSSATNVLLDRVEAKVQLSFKSKVAQGVFGTAGDLWLGYTQQSYWQAANGRYSSPFRETNYQPEGIFIYPLQHRFAGVHVRYLSVALSHESNGRGEALSRSWNRLIGEIAMESGPWSLHLRPWLRVLDPSGERDDNPDIQDYAGRGELTGVYRAGRQVVSMTARHSLRGGDKSRGAARLDWAFPLTGNLNGHLQLFTGYAESLIDYNHSQTTIGFGVSFFD